MICESLSGDYSRGLVRSEGDEYFDPLAERGESADPLDFCIHAEEPNCKFYRMARGADGYLEKLYNLLQGSEVPEILSIGKDDFTQFELERLSEDMSEREKDWADKRAEKIKDTTISMQERMGNMFQRGFTRGKQQESRGEKDKYVG